MNRGCAQLRKGLRQCIVAVLSCAEFAQVADIITILIFAKLAVPADLWTHANILSRCISVHGMLCGRTLTSRLFSEQDYMFGGLPTVSFAYRLETRLLLLQVIGTKQRDYFLNYLTMSSGTL